MNLQTIADAIATVIGTVTATSSTGETETLTCTAALPNGVAKGPILLVFPPEVADLSLIMGPRYDDHYIFTVRLLRDPLDVPARTKWLYAWATALRPKVQANVDLDVAGVVEAQMTRMRVELDGQTYNNSLFDVVEIPVDVHVLENTTAAI